MGGHYGELIQVFELQRRIDFMFQITSEFQTDSIGSDWEPNCMRTAMMFFLNPS